MTTKRKADLLFPAGDDTPILSGTPVPVDVPTTQLTAVDPGTPTGDQSVMFIAETPFDPTAIAGTLSNGTWSAVEGHTLIGGYAYQIKTATARGPIYPVALAVTPADAAVLAQAKRLLALVVRAYRVPADKIADPDWETFRREAQLVLQACATIPKAE